MVPKGPYFGSKLRHYFKDHELYVLTN